MKPKNIPMIRLTEEEYQILQTKKLMVHAKSITETVKKCIFETDNHPDFKNLPPDIDQQIILVMRQNYVTLKLCEWILLEFSKSSDKFRVKPADANQNYITGVIGFLEREAKKFYKLKD